MLGAIAGDIIGSIYEGAGPTSPGFELFRASSRFTDDTVMTVAIAEAILHGSEYGSALRHWGRRYPNAGYGGWFRSWLSSPDSGPYNSFGNGSAMRVAAVGWAWDGLSDVMVEARRTAEVTHNHPEGVKGAQAVAATVLLARMGVDKAAIRRFLEETFGYNCSETMPELRTRHHFDVTCQGTVPTAAVAFLCSANFEEAVRNAVSLGGDADTQGCIAGAMAEAFYIGVPFAIRGEVLRRLDSPLRSVAERFVERYRVPLP